MDRLAELIMSPTYGVKSTDAAKEEKQKKKAVKQYLVENGNAEAELEKKQDTAEQFDIFTQENDRRTEDRRKKDVQRGRWLESRHPKDRRKSPTDIFVKV